jgi:hypothetical protein
MTWQQLLETGKHKKGLAENSNQALLFGRKIFWHRL